MYKSETLPRYVCSKCGKQPSTKDYLLKGCSCGNRLFRVMNSKKEEDITESKSKLEPHVHREMHTDGIAQVKILDDGVFLLDIDGLFKNNGEEPIIISAGGIYKFLNPSKL